MRRDESADVSFPTTRWSLVGRAQTGGPDLAALLKRYWPALRAYLLLERRLPVESADDLLQGFTASRILEQHLLARANSSRGRFRTFLLAALKNYLTDEARAAAALKRRPPQGELLPIEAATNASTTTARSDPFDIEWARQTLGSALRHMRDECVSTKRTDVWELLRLRVIEPALTDAPPLAYEQIVARFGYASPMQASNALITAKRMFARLLRATIAQYARDEVEIEQELADLRHVLAGGGVGIEAQPAASLPTEAP